MNESNEQCSSASITFGGRPGIGHRPAVSAPPCRATRWNSTRRTARRQIGQRPAPAARWSEALGPGDLPSAAFFKVRPSAVISAAAEAPLGLPGWAPQGGRAPPRPRAGRRGQCLPRCPRSADPAPGATGTTDRTAPRRPAPSSADRIRSAGAMNAIDDELEDTVAPLGAFHVVKLASAAVDEVGPRVQQLW